MEPYKPYFEEENIKSAIGSGKAYIYKDKLRDISNIFGKYDEVYVAKDLEDAIEYSLKKEPCVLVIKGPYDVLWAKPVVKGEFISRAMFGGDFIYTSNGVVMKNYSHPIRLMDRLES